MIFLFSISSLEIPQRSTYTSVVLTKLVPFLTVADGRDLNLFKM